jgi:hypothetical protein
MFDGARVGNRVSLQSLPALTGLGRGCRQANRNANAMNKINSHLFAALTGAFAVLAIWHSSEFEPERLLEQVFIGASLVSCFLAFATAMFED